MRRLRCLQESTATGRLESDDGPAGLFEEAHALFLGPDAAKLQAVSSASTAPPQQPGLPALWQSSSAGRDGVGVSPAEHEAAGEQRSAAGRLRPLLRCRGFPGCAQSMMRPQQVATCCAGGDVATADTSGRRARYCVDRRGKKRLQGIPRKLQSGTVVTSQRAAVLLWLG